MIVLPDCFDPFPGPLLLRIPSFDSDAAEYVHRQHCTYMINDPHGIKCIKIRLTVHKQESELKYHEQYVFHKYRIKESVAVHDGKSDHKEYYRNREIKQTCVVYPMIEEQKCCKYKIDEDPGVMIQPVSDVNDP